MNTALAGMPRQWGAGHCVCAMLKGSQKRSLRKVVDQAEPEIKRILEYARQHLRQSLAELGYTFINKGTESGSRSQSTSGNSVAAKPRLPRSA